MKTMSPVLHWCVVVYLLLAIVYAGSVPEWYAMLTMYVAFKWITNYRKCTISYYECKLRGVPKERGWLYSFLEELVDLRKSPLVAPALLLHGLVLFQFYSRAVPVRT
jgi:hypothetical protein